ncbi:hypothetical protein BH11MYX1_BH11MYX1_21310 [soil metagenome]
MNSSSTGTLVTLLSLVAGVGASSASAGPAKKPPKKEAKPEAPAPAPPAPEPTITQFPKDGRKIIGILDVRIDGAPTEVGAQFQRDLEAQVDTKHYYLAPRVRMHDILANSTKWTEGCVVGDCLREARAQTGAEVVLLASLSGSGTSFGWVITLVSTQMGTVIGQESERCDVCTISEALSTATLATVKLLNAIPDELGAPKPGPSPTKPYEVELEHMHHARRVAGTAFTITGVAVAAIGAAIYFAKDHSKPGLGVAGVGGGLLLGGVFTLAF